MLTLLAIHWRHAAFFTKAGDLTQYATTAQAIFQESVNAAASGETWPLWGTCLGFELINVLVRRS